MSLQEVVMSLPSSMSKPIAVGSSHQGPNKGCLLIHTEIPSHLFVAMIYEFCIQQNVKIDNLLSIFELMFVTSVDLTNIHRYKAIWFPGEVWTCATVANDLVE